MSETETQRKIKLFILCHITGKIEELRFEARSFYSKASALKTMWCGIVLNSFEAMMDLRYMSTCNEILCFEGR